MLRKFMMLKISISRISPECFKTAITTNQTGIALSYVQQNKDNYDVINGELNDSITTTTTPLILAASYNQSEVVHELLKIAFIDFNAADSIGFTALMWAANNGNSTIIQALLAKPGLDLTAVSDSGETAETLALNRGHHEIARQLGKLANEQHRSKYRQILVK